MTTTPEAPMPQIITHATVTLSGPPLEPETFNNGYSDKVYDLDKVTLKIDFGDGEPHLRWSASGTHLKKDGTRGLTSGQTIGGLWEPTSEATREAFLNAARQSAATIDGTAI